MGYSNGANIAASLLLLRPSTLTAAILFHAMVPFVPESLPDLSDKRILITAGKKDPIVGPEEAERLAEMFRLAGADVTLKWQEGGHHLSGNEVEAARDWLSNL